MINFDKKNTNKDAYDFNSIINKSSSTPKKVPWYKKRSSIIAMSSTLGVGVLAAAVAVPVVLFVDFNPKKSEPISLKVERFNLRGLTEKIADFNKMITPQFQNSVYDFWMKDSAAVVAETISTKDTQFYNYVLNNLDQTSTVTSTGFVTRSVNQFMTYYTTPPLSGTDNSFTPVTNNMFKILAPDSTERSFISSVNITGGTPVAPAYRIYNLSSLFSSNNILDINFNLNPNETLDVSVTNNEISSNFLNFVTNNASNSRHYKYNETYTLNDEYTNNLLSPLIKNFLNTNI